MINPPTNYTSDTIKAILERDAQERKSDNQADFSRGTVFVKNQEEIDEAIKNNWPIPVKNWAASFQYTWGRWIVWTEGRNFAYKSKTILYPI